MEEDPQIQEGQNKLFKEESFVEKYRLKEYSKNNYLICTYRFSLIEKVITKYIFQTKNSEYSLYPLLVSLYKDPSAKSLFLSFLQFFIEKFGKESPLYFYNQISKEIIRIFNLENLSNIQYDDFILKIEFLLAWHFENNFYPRRAIFELFESLNDHIYLNNGVTNYVYSIESINTIEHFLKIFEKQTLCTRINGDLQLIDHLFCNEKVYYFYCDTYNKKKLLCGNMIKYLLEQLNVKISKTKYNNKINSADIENYIMMNLYLIDKIIQQYSFYLYKDPELTEIFNSLIVFKTWPCPISNYCNRVIENIINENSLQGISIFNKIRQMYYLDLIDHDITSIDTKLFKYTLVIHSKEWENRHQKDKNNVFNVVKFIDYLKNKPKSKKTQKLLFKELLLKLLITIIYNSDQPFNDNTFKQLYEIYMPKCDNIYDDNNPSIENDKVKASLDKLIKIIDVGFDKTLDNFNEEINIMAKKILAKTKYDEFNFEYKKNIMENEFYLPINSMRNYIKPHYTEFKTLYKYDKNNKDSNDDINIFDSYINNFTKIVNTYFKFLLTSSKDSILAKNLEVIRKNFFQTFRINILLIEEENSINDFIENLQNKVFQELDTKISDNDFNKFWKYFVDEKKEIVPKFLLHLVPYYEKQTSNPFKILTEENPLKTKENYLSEYIANNDYIYKSIIFMPFASTCDNTLVNYINNSPSKSDNIMLQPPINTLFSPLKKCLNYYIGDSSGIFNLDLYKVTINDNVIEKVFYKNIEILDKANEFYRQTKLTLTCVDLLGIEYKEVKEINLGNNDFNIKIFNLFYKNNVPFNYKMTSNNGWLELFLDDKYNIQIDDKLCNFQNFIQLNKETKYYEEFNLPQTELESRFHNYKVKSLLIESNSPSIFIKCDDYDEIKYNEKIDMGAIKKNNNELKLKIKIEPFMVNDERYSIPIATFTTI